MRNFLCVIFLGFLTCLQAQKKNTLHLKITDNFNQPVLATITVDAKLSYMCDINGDVNVLLSNGTHTIKVKSLGYQLYQTEVIIKKDTLLKIELERDRENLNEVFLNYNKNDVKKEHGLTVHTIDVKSRNAQSVTINQLLKEVSGVQVTENGGLGSRSNYRINGLGGRSVRLFIDGIPMDYYGTAYSLQTIPSQTIKNIDVYKGVVPIDLGADALGGAININRINNLTNKLYASYSIGSFNTHKASVFGNYRNSKNGFFTEFMGAYNYSDNNYKVWGDEITFTNSSTYNVERGMKVERFHDAFSSKTGEIKTGFSKVSWADRIYLGMLFSTMDKEIQHGPTMANVYGEATYHQQLISPHLLYEKKNVVPKLDVKLFSMLSNLQRHRNDISKNIYDWNGDVVGERTVGGEQDYTLNKLEQNTVLLRANVVYHLTDKSNILINSVFSNLKRTESDAVLKNVNDGYWSPQYHSKQVTGLSFNSKVNQRFFYSVFGKKYNYSADIKVSEYIEGEPFYSNVKVNDGNYGYGLTTRVKLGTNANINFSFENATRLPESDEILGDGVAVVYADDLQPETSLNFNIGTSYQVFSNAMNSLNLEGNYFYRNTKNLIQKYQNDASTFKYINFGKVLSTGVDFGIKYSWKQNLKFQSSISYVNPIVKSETDEQGNQNVTFDSKLPNISPFIFSNYVSYGFENLLQKKSVTTCYASNQFTQQFYRYSDIIGAFNKDTVPNQWNHTIGISHQFPNKKIIISADVTNVFNKQLYDNYAVQKPGRAFYVKVNYEL